MTPSPLITYGPIAGTPFDNFTSEVFWLFVALLIILFGAAIYSMSFDEDYP